MIQTGVVSTGLRCGLQETTVVQFRSEQSKVFQQRNGHAGRREPPTTERGDTATLFIRWEQGQHERLASVRRKPDGAEAGTKLPVNSQCFRTSTTFAPLPFPISFCLKCIGTEGNEGNEDRHREPNAFRSLIVANNHPAYAGRSPADGYFAPRDAG